MTTVQRNFYLDEEQAEWLRELAHRRRVKQVDIVRHALAATRAELEGRPRPPLPGTVRRNAAELGGMLAGGPALAEELLADRRGEERREERVG